MLAGVLVISLISAGTSALAEESTNWRNGAMTEESSEEEPSKEEPTAEEPSKEEPSKEEPLKEEPSKEEPTVEEPTAEEPSEEEPTKEEPTEEEPTEEEPTTEELTAEEPSEEEPTEEELTTEEDTTEEESSTEEQSTSTDSDSGDSSVNKTITVTVTPDKPSVVEQPEIEQTPEDTLEENTTAYEVPRTGDNDIYANISKIFAIISVILTACFTFFDVKFRKKDKVTK